MTFVVMNNVAHSRQRVRGSIPSFSASRLLYLQRESTWGARFSEDAPYKIMIVDDHDCIIQALSASLGAVEEYEVVATAQNAEEARQRIYDEIDFVIMDIELLRTAIE
jgi:PleD family two-component response regulator